MTDTSKPLAGYGILFDIDGVLVDSYAAHLESWRRLAAECGVSITEAQFAATFGRTSREIIRELFSIENDAAVRAKDERKEAIYRELIREAVPEMPGARALVALLARAGARIAIGSSGPPENVELVCRELGLDPFLAGRVTGADVTRGKPDPQVFLLAAGRIGIAPARCVVIEDAPAGVEAAHRAGMVCIALRSNYAREAALPAELVVGQLKEITILGILALFPAG